jgi:hypothetical protein
MAELITLAVATGATTTIWRVRQLTLERGLTSSGGPIVSDPTRASIRAWLVGENGLEKLCQWDGATADTLIIALNKANLTTISLEKRVLNQAVTDGKLSGTISGSPD